MNFEEKIQELAAKWITVIDDGGTKFATGVNITDKYPPTCGGGIRGQWMQRDIVEMQVTSMRKALSNVLVEIFDEAVKDYLRSISE